MVDYQYPHKMVFQTIGPESLQGEDGHWIPSAGAETIEHKCRASVANANRGGNFVKSADGQELYYAWIVYTPTTCPVIPVGTAVTVYQDGNVVRATGTAKQFVKEDLHARLWL